MFWTNIAYAAGGGAPGEEPNFLIQMAPLILMFVIFYFLLIRPQQKRAKEHRNMVSSLRKGDEVITSGGIYGRVVDTDEESLMVDLGETTVRIQRAAVATVAARASNFKDKDKKSKKKNQDQTEDEE